MKQRIHLYDHHVGLVVEQLRCIAACIFDEHREPFAAISISGPISRMTDDRVTELGALVIKAAKEVTLAYGGIR